MNKPKLWIVSELFYPEEVSTAYILTKIANGLIRDFDINVITGPQVYEATDKFQETTYNIDDTIKIIRVKGISNAKNNLFKRSINFLYLSVAMGFVLSRYANKGDKVLTVTNPAPFVVVATKVASIKKLDLTLIVHDVFPENAIAADIIKNSRSILYKLLKRLFDHSYAKANKLIVLGRDMRDIVDRKIKPFNSRAVIHIVENWADKEILEADSVPLQDTTMVKIQYAGNIGRVQGLKEFITDFLAINNTCLNLDIYGKGAYEKEIASLIAEQQNNSIRLMGAFSRRSQNNIIQDCDIALVTLSDNMYGLGVPSKSYNIMACGKPILFIGDPKSEIGLLVKENNLGFVFSSEDREAIQDFLSNLTINMREELADMGQRAKKIAAQFYTEEMIIAKYNKILK